MKTSLLLFGLVLAAPPMMSVGKLSAGMLLSLSPAGGAVSALPGGVTGWGFTLSNDTGYAVIDNAELIPAGSLGIFTDFISQPSNFTVIGPDRPFAQRTWTEGFNETLQTGLGDFHVDSRASRGDSVTGEIRVFYDLFCRSPFDPAFDPDVDTVSTGNFTSAAVSVRVNAPAVHRSRKAGFCWGAVSPGCCYLEGVACGVMVCSPKASEELAHNGLAPRGGCGRVSGP